jgi:uncharacterized membrane protein YecN with MAPEG domain
LLFSILRSTIALHIGANAFIPIALALNVCTCRDAQGKLDPGAVGDAALTRAAGAHGKFTEYAPLVLPMLLGLQC